MACIVANAQFNTGRYLLGGELSFGTEKIDDYSKPSNESIYASIKVGKVIKENTVVGIIYLMDIAPIITR